MGHWEQTGKENREARKPGQRRLPWEAVMTATGAAALWALVIAALLR